MCYLILLMTITIPPLGLLGGLFGLYQNFKKWPIYIFCISLCVASIAYCYYPKGLTDIVRYVAYINRLKGLSLGEALRTGIKGETNTFVFSFFCWIAARIDDPQLIPSISAFFVYYCGLYVTCKVGEDYKIGRNKIVGYVIFTLLALNMYSVINNVRNVFSFTLISFALFRDLYQKRRNVFTIILYIFPVFIHQSAVLFILIRVTFHFASKVKIVLFALAGFFNVFSSLAGNLISRIQSDNVIVNLLKTLILKADMYYNDTSSRWGLTTSRSMSYRIERIANISFAVLMCVIIVYISRTKEKRNVEIEKREKDLVDFAFVLCLLTISCAPMLMPEYWRFFSVSVLFSAIVYYEAQKGSIVHVKNLSNCIFLITPVTSIIWIRELLNSDLRCLLIRPFVSSPLFIVINDLIKF